ncbi:histone-lysine N-methyltransferase family member SUVH2-like [Punica granatum]|uniref:Histone-lysine N-methyltransferase family member SUVH2-like n=2 Tax=Punica granatum TaxID=22663 RepID=A0A6P8DS89_PUNGR|nr:histone-lysine N-methyltransferase family member SUVH2-like [Punica granatum]XP_031397225.1 histone-lysine N-methyltransferase family member SUVH2-like [Punica granatum]OWM91116.1 hypothetical protein CDL15_Pgr010146 [Punica granatum]PKI68268.1 hypothetical protein CRG98_011348 [Punica granatum]
MGAMVPFQDLNLLPDPPLSASSTALRTPKIEPKAEPLDVDHHLPPVQTTTQPQLPNSHTAPEPISTEMGETHLYSEFNRISELFHAAFSNRLSRLRLPDSPAAAAAAASPASPAVSESDSRAIVPVPENNNQLSAPRSNKKLDKRSSELVRVTGLSSEDERFFREVVRRTRMVYDGLRILSTSQQDSHAPHLTGRRLRGDLAAASVMRAHGLWLNRDKRVVGPIPGVYVGDMFLYRMELCVVGLHGQPQAGIDYLTASESSNGEPIATSIIVSGGYEDDEDSGDVLVYSGHGGQDKFSRQCAHQKLEGGNLAMAKSMHYGIEVRVIRGFRQGACASNKVYVYDGLYRIIDYWLDVGKSGFGVYKYKLSRIEGQPLMGSSIMKFAETLKIRPLEVRPSGYLSLDVSVKREAVPIPVFNDIDSNNEPLCFEYLSTSVFPPFLVHQNGGMGTGCECLSGCREGCICAAKNGGEFAYDPNGILFRGKPVVFECGVSCKCPPSCRNRVTQRGLRIPLEIFRSREAGWAVRSLDLIQAGSFICEYSGVVLTRDQAQVFSMNGDSLVYPNRFAGKWAEWGDLSRIFPNYVCPSYPSIPPLDFAMDVSRMRNVACYISHSSTPNVFVQYVLQDHNNISFPRLMLFALENIPPLRELSLDYGVADEWSGKPMICN